MPMAYRDRLKRKVTPLLEPGETPQFVFIARAGSHTLLFSTTGLLGVFLAKPRVVAVTDRAIVVMQANLNGTSPTKVLARLPRKSQIGPVKGLWARINLDGTKLWVGKGWHEDVRAADAVAMS